MPRQTNKMISDFTDKPTTEGFYRRIDNYTMSLGSVVREQRAQVSYAVKRKFLWLWAYEKTTDGTLYLNVTLDRVVHEPHLHTLTQVSPHRWNHHVVVKSLETATSTWLADLILQGFEFARQ